MKLAVVARAGRILPGPRSSALRSRSPTQTLMDLVALGRAIPNNLSQPQPADHS